MSTSTIGKQAGNYAEVIVGQIVSNFETLSTTVKHCDELKKAKMRVKARKRVAKNLSKAR